MQLTVLLWHHRRKSLNWHYIYTEVTTACEKAQLYYAGCVHLSVDWLFWKVPYMVVSLTLDLCYREKSQEISVLKLGTFNIIRPIYLSLIPSERLKSLIRYITSNFFLNHLIYKRALLCCPRVSAVSIEETPHKTRNRLLELIFIPLMTQY